MGGIDFWWGVGDKNLVERGESTGRIFLEGRGGMSRFLAGWGGGGGGRGRFGGGGGGGGLSPHPRSRENPVQYTKSFRITMLS